MLLSVLSVLSVPFTIIIPTSYSSQETSSILPLSQYMMVLI
jgi:hypothetical protein